MRADRLLSILLLLQVHRRMTARELAKRLEVSERTIHRDMEALSMAGVPVVAERGANGGWSLPDGYRTNVTGLNQAEVLALFLPRPAGVLQDLGLGQAAEAAQIRLLAALPSGARQDAEFARQRIHVDGAPWHPKEGDDLTGLPLLQDAIWQERKVLLAYDREDGRVERLADPLGLVVKGSTWYLAASVDGELRTYRVSRIAGVTLTDQPCSRPAGFDLAAFWADSSARFVSTLPKYHARVRANPAILKRLKHTGKFVQVEQVAEPDPDGWVPVTIRFQTEEEACHFVLGFGPQIAVIEPETLRERVIRLVQELAAFYEVQMTSHS